MTHKVGDKVKIRTDLIEARAYSMDNSKVKDSFIGDMLNFSGKNAIIKHANNGGYELDIDDEEWNWTDEMFE